jgi:peptidoglycan/LPS O-acetylase OafA/YrhL
LAVDLFFMMSGFVVAHAYEGRLRSGWSLGDFMRVRVLRLWPLYLLGTLIGAAVFASAVDGPVMAAALAMMMAAAVLLIPLPLGAEVQIFNLNRPAWSLFFEMIANLLYGAFARRLTERILILLSVVGAFAVVVAFGLAGTGSLGHHGDGLLGGAARILFGFPLGVLVHRLHQAGRLTVRASIPVILAAFLAALALPDLGRLNGWLDAGVVILLFPLLVAVAVGAEVNARTASVFAFLADLSYPLYILHGPILMGFAQFGGESTAVLLAGGGVSLVAAWAAGRWFDPWGRRALARLIALRQGSGRVGAEAAGRGPIDLN